MSEARSKIFEFGEFVLDPDRGSLLRSGRDINLRPQTFEVLSILVRQRGSLVTREEMLSAVWHEAPVTDDSLTQCIVEIRKAIGDQDRLIIRTVPKRGFVFDPAAADSHGEAADGNTCTGDDAKTDTAARSTRRLGYAAAAVAVIAAVLFALLPPDSRETSMPVTGVPQSAPSAASIAVLPFEDLSETQDQAYFGEGIAEEILLRLGEYPQLVTIGRSSSFQFRDRQSDVVAIGHRLNVAYVLDGSIRRSGNQFRIGAQLLETQNGTQVWSQSFDRELTAGNLFDIQSEVAASVAETIAAGAELPVRDRTTALQASSAEAYEHYLEGMFYLHRIRMADRSVFGPELYDLAIERLEAAIDLDPEWPAPHVALGRIMILRAESILDDDMDNAEAYDWYRLAKQSLLNAIRLDPDSSLAYSSLAYSSLGHVLHRLDFDFPAADAAFNRARALGDYLPWVYAMFLLRSGRVDEAIEQYRLAIEQDPLLVGPRHQLASAYRAAGRYDESVSQLEEVLRLAPSRDDLYLPLAYLYLKTGRIREGRELFEKYADPESTSIQYGPIYALLGMTDKANEVLALAEADEHWWLEDFIATALMLGERKRLLDYLEAAANEDPRRLVHIPGIDGIRSLNEDARFRQILKDAGFPEQSI